MDLLQLNKKWGERRYIVSRKENFNRSEINVEELVRAVTVLGFNVREYIQEKNWKITRQGLYYILSELGVDLSILERRGYYWHVARCVRLHPELLNRNWIKRRTIKQIVKELKISKNYIYKIKNFLNAETRKKELRTIILTCSNCGKKFKKRHANYKQRVKGLEKWEIKYLKFYCPDCANQKVWLRFKLKNN